MYLGDLVEFGATEQIFFKPQRQRNRRLHHRPLRLIRGDSTCLINIFRPSSTAELNSVSTRVMEMGGMVESPDPPGDLRADASSAWKRVQVESLDGRARQRDGGGDRPRSASIIARRQPTARDLRLLMAISKAIANLERMGDEAHKHGPHGQVHHREVVARAPYPAHHAICAWPARDGLGPLRKALDAFARLDTKAAVAILEGRRPDRPRSLTGSCANWSPT